MDNPMEPDPEPIACQNAGVSGVGALTGPPACAVPKGFGRVTRDAEGNIVSVEMNEEENAVESAKEPALVENRAAGITPEGSRWVIGGYPNSSAGRRSNVLEGEHDARIARFLRYACADPFIVPANSALPVWSASLRDMGRT